MTAPYGWIITKDHISEGADVGRAGPRDLSPEILAKLDKGEGQAFRMFDDDGERYYDGLLLGEDTEGFEPLDDFGTPNAGCTEIQYKNPKTGAWETL